MLLSCQSPLFAQTTFKGCADAYPPFTYFKEPDTKKILGITIDILHAISKKANINIELDMTPWARCQAEVLKGTEYTFLVDASSNPKRIEEYIQSNLIHTINNYYFFSSKNKDKVKLNSIADLKKYQVCGMFGNDYEDVGLKTGDPNLDTGSKKYEDLFTKVAKGRCDLFIEPIEVIMAYNKSSGKDLLKQNHLIYKKADKSTSTKMYYFLSKNKNGEQLAKIINKQIEEMKKNGTMTKIWKKYGSEYQNEP